LNVTISTLVVGLGSVGLGYDLSLDPERFVLTHARAASQHRDYELLGAVDPDSSRRRSFEDAYHCPSFPDLETASKNISPELVIVAAPTEFHLELIESTLKYFSPAIILCEKPLAYSVAAANRIIELCEQYKVQLFVNYMRRSDPGAIEVANRIASEALGSDLKGIAWYSKGLAHNGSHITNLLEYWLGEPKSAQIINPGRRISDKDAEPDFQVDYQRGSMVFLAAKEEYFSHYTIELLGSRGRLLYGSGGKLIQWQPARRDDVLQNYVYLSPMPEVIFSGMDKYQQHVFDELASSLQGGDAHICTGSAALSTLTFIQDNIFQKIAI
jgi:predicted dehydrogenase